MLASGREFEIMVTFVWLFVREIAFFQLKKGSFKLIEDVDCVGVVSLLNGRWYFWWKVGCFFWKALRLRRGLF